MLAWYALLSICQVLVNFLDPRFSTQPWPPVPTTSHSSADTSSLTLFHCAPPSPSSQTNPHLSINAPRPWPVTPAPDMSTPPLLLDAVRADALATLTSLMSVRPPPRAKTVPLRRSLPSSSSPVIACNKLVNAVSLSRGACVIGISTLQLPNTAVAATKFPHCTRKSSSCDLSEEPLSWL